VIDEVALMESEGKPENYKEDNYEKEITNRC